MIKSAFLIVATCCSLQLFSQEKFPDGKIIPDWFYKNEKTDINGLGKSFLITDYGVVNDSTLLQTEKIQAVIDLASNNGGGVIVIPEGTYLSGALFFKPGTHLHLEEKAILKGSDDISNFPVIETRMEGQNLKYFSALINVDKVDGFTLSGNGKVDGNGERYWKSFWLRRRVIPKCTNMDELRPRLLHISHIAHERVNKVEDVLNIGDEVEVKVTFPEDYQATDLAGKAAVFVTKVNEVKAKEVPALDDELAKDLDDEVETLDELKAKYRKELEAAKEIAYDDAVEGAALDLAVENAEIVELPAEMVEDEVHRAMNEFMGNMQRQGISPEMYFQITGTTQEDLHKQYEADADKRVKTNLVIEAVAAAEGFDATEEEIQKEINDLAAEYNMEVSQVSALLSPEMLKHDITMKKAVEVITSTAKVK